MVSVGTAQAGVHSVSFLVDPDTIDANNDGFITGGEFQPVGSSGHVFALTPTNNLVGADRFLLSDTRGLHFGGGGGSTLSFDFSVNQDIELTTYTIASTGFILNNPLFDLRKDADVLSTGNDATPNGLTAAFGGGPVTIEAGETYSFVVTNTGAAIQSFMDSWNYNVVPAPAGIGALGLFGLASMRRRR